MIFWCYLEESDTVWNDMMVGKRWQIFILFIFFIFSISESQLFVYSRDSQTFSSAEPLCPKIFT